MKRFLCLMTALALCGTLAVPALAVETETVPTEYDVTWETLDERIRFGGWNAQILAENINTIDALDYEVLKERLRTQLNEIARAQWMMIMMGAYEEADKLDSTYDALRENFDAIKDGDMQKDNANRLWQLNDGLNQIVSGGQTLYLTILDMEQSLSDGNRGLETIDRNLAELRLRQKLGQVSAAQVASLEQTRAETVEQLRTLERGISTGKTQLQSVIGEEPTGELTLAPLPAEDDRDWDDLDYEADLAAAKEHSWALYDAGLTRKDAKDAWIDDRNTGWQYAREMADHTWAAAQAAYEAQVEEFTASFRSLHIALEDTRRVWESKKSAAAYQETLLKSAQRKYELGLISKYVLLDAQDALASAKGEADRAWRELFAARNNYNNAVLMGLVK